MEMHEIVKKLIGSIEPYGDTNIDEEHMKNLNKHIELVDKLLDDLILVAKYKNRPEASMKEIGERAYDMLKEFHNNIECYLEL